MYFRTPMYEGDGFIRDGLAAHIEPLARFDGLPHSHREQAFTLEQLQALERAAREERSAWVRGWLAGIGAWLAAIPARARETASERYLKGSTDLADLERRLRDLEYSRRKGIFA